jgi:hypothetical protein
MILAGLAEDHEGFADIFRTLHPTGLPLATVGLAAQLICSPSVSRKKLRYAIEASHAPVCYLYAVGPGVPLVAQTNHLILKSQQVENLNKVVSARYRHLAKQTRFFPLSEFHEYKMAALHQSSTIHN